MKAIVFIACVLFACTAISQTFRNPQTTEKKRKYQDIDSIDYTIIYRIDTTNFTMVTGQPHYKAVIQVLKQGKPFGKTINGVFSECWFCDNGWMWVQAAKYQTKN